MRGALALRVLCAMIFSFLLPSKSGGLRLGRLLRQERFYEHPRLVGHEWFSVRLQHTRSRVLLAAVEGRDKKSNTFSFAYERRSECLSLM